jgi:hypothetical protein
LKSKNTSEIVITGKKVIKRKGVEIEVMTMSRRVDQKNAPEVVLKLNKIYSSQK